MHLISMIFPFLISAAAAYLIGSISFSIIFTRLFKKVDVRKCGSGNAGATNVLRTAGKLPALLTFVFDFLKCVLAIYVALLIFSHSTAEGLEIVRKNVSLIKYMAGLFCVLGHIYPVYFGFHGGKGVLSSAALILLIDWRLFCLGISVFLIVLFFSKIVSLSSISAMLSLPVITFIVQTAEHSPFAIENSLFALLFAAIIIYKHKGNIKRLIQGTEPKIGRKEKEKEPLDV